MEGNLTLRGESCEKCPGQKHLLIYGPSPFQGEPSFSSPTPPIGGSVLDVTGSGGKSKRSKYPYSQGVSYMYTYTRMLTKAETEARRAPNVNVIGSAIVWFSMGRLPKKPHVSLCTLALNTAGYNRGGQQMNKACKASLPSALIFHGRAERQTDNTVKQVEICLGVAAKAWLDLCFSLSYFFFSASLFPSS